MLTEWNRLRAKVELLDSSESTFWDLWVDVLDVAGAFSIRTHPLSREVNFYVFREGSK
jgi:hypothetical protein